MMSNQAVTIPVTAVVSVVGADGHPFSSVELIVALAKTVGQLEARVDALEGQDEMDEPQATSSHSCSECRSR